MILAFVWAAGIAGIVAALVQLVLPSRVDLRPLIFGSFAVVILLGTAGLGWEGALALTRATLVHPHPVAVVTGVGATLHLLRATGYLAFAVALIGGIAVWVRVIALGRRRKRAASAAGAPAAETPAPSV